MQIPVQIPCANSLCKFPVLVPAIEAHREAVASHPTEISDESPSEISDEAFVPSRQMRFSPPSILLCKAVVAGSRRHARIKYRAS